jgi:hypothetical protein
MRYEPVRNAHLACGMFCLAALLGYLIEGNKPAFLTNPAHVFVAPVWMVRRIFGQRRKAERGQGYVRFRRSTPRQVAHCARGILSRSGPLSGE